MRELKPGTPVFVIDPAGQRVRATVWDGRADRAGEADLYGRVTVVTDNGWWLGRDMSEVEVRKPDIPRERVEALHAAVTARLEQLDASRGATYFASERDILAACHSDLSEVAEALRLLLEVDP